MMILSSIYFAALKSMLSDEVQISQSIEWENNKTVMFIAYNTSQQDIIIDLPAGTYYWVDTNIESTGDADPPDNVTWDDPFNTPLGDISRSFAHNQQEELVPVYYGIEVSIKNIYCRAVEAEEGGLILPWQVAYGSNALAYKKYEVSVDSNPFELAVQRETRIEKNHVASTLVFRYMFQEEGELPGGGGA